MYAAPGGGEERNNISTGSEQSAGRFYAEPGGETTNIFTETRLDEKLQHHMGGRTESSSHHLQNEGRRKRNDGVVS